MIREDVSACGLIIKATDYLSHLKDKVQERGDRVMNAPFNYFFISR